MIGPTIANLRKRQAAKRRHQQLGPTIRRLRRRQARLQRRRVLIHLKNLHACEHCGSREDRTWHHLTKKNGNIDACMHWPWLLRELCRCIVLCHSCHIKLHKAEPRAQRARIGRKKPRPAGQPTGAPSGRTGRKSRVRCAVGS